MYNKNGKSMCNKLPKSIFEAFICVAYGLNRVFHIDWWYPHAYIQKWVWISVHHHSWWRHKMETFSALLAFCTGNSPVQHKGQWRGALIFSLVCAWTNSWANNGDAGYLRRYRTHYDVIVMIEYEYRSQIFYFKALALNEPLLSYNWIQITYWQKSSPSCPQ